MSENFEPITTQEQFDNRISERLKRERETAEKKYADYDSLKKQITDLNDQLSAATKQAEESTTLINGLQGKVKGYESHSVKTRIARNAGIPEEFADRLVGTDEESLKADAESMAKLISSKQPVAPMASSEGDTQKEDHDRVQMREMLRKLKGE